MKNLSTFKTNKITTAEQANVKGGIRFVTDNYGKAVAKINKLINDGTNYMLEYEICPDGTLAYCIEW